MTTEFLMPRLSETGDSGTILKWLVEPGASVRKGEIVVHVESDKAVVELEAPISGQVQRICFTAGDLVPAGAVLALLGDPGAPFSEVDPAYLLAGAESVGQALRPIQDSTTSSEARGVDDRSARNAQWTRRPRRVRRTEAEPGAGAAPHDLLRRLQHSESPTALPFSPTPAEITPLSKTRAAIGDNLLASLRPAPHAFVEVEADVTNLAAYREGFQPDERPSYTAIFVQAAAAALREMPELNASLLDSGVCQWKEVNIALALARQGGLVAPVIRSADQLGLSEISSVLRSFGRNREDPLPQESTMGGTFTISDLGMFGADSLLSVISPGQAAILSFGRIRAKPAAIDGALVIRSFVRMTLSFDHRILDGATAAQFLARLEAMFVRPEAWAH